MGNIKNVMDDNWKIIEIDVTEQPDWKIKYKHVSWIPFEVTEEEKIIEVKPKVPTKKTTKKKKK